MAVAKGKARENRTEEGQRKVRGPTGVRTSGRTALLTKTNLHRAGPGGRKKQKEELKGAPPPHPVRVLFLSLSLSPTCWGALLFTSLD